MMTATDKFTWSTYDTLLRLDFVSFAQRCFRELSPRAQFAMNWHIEIIAAKLMALRAGKIRRLIINLPPRYLKSLLASIAFPAWCLGHDPSAQILCVSYAQELADKLARDCRQHHDEPVVSADLPDPPGAAPPGGAGVHHHPPGISPRHLHRRRADRARRRPHPDR